MDDDEASGSDADELEGDGDVAPRLVSNGAAHAAGNGAHAVHAGGDGDEDMDFAEGDIQDDADETATQGGTSMEVS